MLKLWMASSASHMATSIVGSSPVSTNPSSSKYSVISNYVRRWPPLTTNAIRNSTPKTTRKEVKNKNPNRRRNLKRRSQKLLRNPLQNRRKWIILLIFQQLSLYWTPGNDSTLTTNRQRSTSTYGRISILTLGVGGSAATSTTTNTEWVS